jgi:hypothetical protein
MSSIDEGFIPGKKKDSKAETRIKRLVPRKIKAEKMLE